MEIYLKGLKFVMNKMTEYPAILPRIYEEMRMEKLIITKIQETNLHRTRYLLSHYHQFSAQCSSSIDLRVSRAVLDILSYHFVHRDIYCQEDCDLIDHCGAILVPAVNQILEEIRFFPYEIAKTMYPVIYHFYFSPDGKATDLVQLSCRLEKESLFLEEEALRSWLDRGERAFSMLLFPNRMVAAMSAWS